MVLRMCQKITGLNFRTSLIDSTPITYENTCTVNKFLKKSVDSIENRTISEYASKILFSLRKLLVFNSQIQYLTAKRTED